MTVTAPVEALTEMPVEAAKDVIDQAGDIGGAVKGRARKGRKANKK